jgi:hypothetical protein
LGILAKSFSRSTQNTMRNTHIWKTENAEGERREVRAEKFGGRWRLQAKLKSDALWTYYDDPPLEGENDQGSRGIVEKRGRRGRRITLAFNFP